MINDRKWSPSEKKIARQVFEAALEAELAEILADFKAQAAAITDADELWPLEDHLRRQRRYIQEKYDYRYSVLILLFGRLVREGRVQQAQLHGLAPEKLAYIERMLSL